MCRRRESSSGTGGVTKKAGVKSPSKAAGIRSTSKYRGVTHHCRTGRYESHIWDSGKQVYLGGFDTEEQVLCCLPFICECRWCTSCALPGMIVLRRLALGCAE